MTSYGCMQVKVVPARDQESNPSKGWKAGERNPAKLLENAGGLFRRKEWGPGNKKRIGPFTTGFNQKYAN